MIVQRANNHDLTQLAVLFDHYRQSKGATANLEQSYHYLKQRLQQQQTVIFMLVKSESVVGFVILYLGFSSLSCSSHYILDDVYVTPTCRAQGAAKQLIDTAILFARQENAMQISVKTTQNNTVAEALYAKMGFLKDEQHQTHHCLLR